MTVYRISKDGEVQQVAGTPALDPVTQEPTGELEEHEGWTIEDEAEGELGLYDKVEGGEIVLNAEKLDAELHARIDLEHGDFTRLFVTEGPAMQMMYRDKGEQAKAVIAGEIDQALYLMIAREAVLRGMEVLECALWIESIADDWSAIRDLIEPARQGAKLAVTAAATEAEKRAAAEVDYWAVLAGGQVAGI